MKNYIPIIKLPISFKIDPLFPRLFYLLRFYNIIYSIKKEAGFLLPLSFLRVFRSSHFLHSSSYSQFLHIKLMIDGVTSRAFSATTMPPVQFERSFREKIIEVSRKEAEKGNSLLK